jgi:hypothetical protein
MLRQSAGLNHTDRSSRASYCFTLKTEIAGSSEMPVNTCQDTGHHTPLKTVILSKSIQLRATLHCRNCEPLFVGLKAFERNRRIQRKCIPYPLLRSVNAVLFRQRLTRTIPVSSMHLAPFHNAEKVRACQLAERPSAASRVSPHIHTGEHSAAS